MIFWFKKANKADDKNFGIKAAKSFAQENPHATVESEEFPLFNVSKKI